MKIKYTNLLIFILLLFTHFTAAASEEVTVCAKYKTNHGWSSEYKVNGLYLSGFELAQATKRNDFNFLDKYVVIFWGEDEVTIIQLDFPLLTVFEEDGIDQQGRQWKVSKSSFCLY